MKKSIFVSLIYLLTFCMSAFAEDIVGFWKTISDETGEPESVIAIYEYQGKYYGRIIGSYNEDGKMDDTIYEPKDRAPGIQGNPYYSGMDFIWGLREKGDSKYKGKVIDPRKGKVYDAEVWVSNGNLILRGEVFIFGRNEVWPPATDSDFPKGFKKPDITKFVPKRPQVE